MNDYFSKTEDSVAWDKGHEDKFAEDLRYIFKLELLQELINLEKEKQISKQVPLQFFHTDNEIAMQLAHRIL